MKTAGVYFYNEGENVGYQRYDFENLEDLKKRIEAAYPNIDYHIIVEEEIK